MSLTKKDIADTLAKKISIKKNEALVLTNLFFDEISAKLIVEKDVKLSGFGNFIILKKRSRPGRNPKTGKEVEISARKIVTFKAGSKFKKTTKENSI